MMVLIACWTVVSQAQDSSHQPFTCEMQPEIGSCKGAFPRYFYDQKDNSCQQFIWGGCGGVVPFQSLESCQLACEPIKHQTKTSYRNAVNKSLKLWQGIKETHSDYSYSVLFSSWVGFRHSTVLTIKDHKMHSREYKAWSADRKLSQQWKETSAQVGLYEAGAEPLTLDQLYTQCLSIIDEFFNKHNHFRLKFNEQGLLKTCAYTPKQCADDCTQGIEIENLNFKY